MADLLQNVPQQFLYYSTARQRLRRQSSSQVHENAHMVYRL